MTDSNTPINPQAEVFDGNVVFDNVFILNSLDYDFSNEDITTRNLRVTGIATFGTSSTVIDGATDTIQVGTALTIGHSQGLQFHTQNLHSTGFEVNQINVGGIATITSDLYLTGALVDSSGNTGSSGQLLASTGSGTDWINANSTSVLNAINVGVNLVSSGADHFVSFFEASSGNRPNRVGSQFTYNPATNTMSGINHAGTSTFNNVNFVGPIGFNSATPNADIDFQQATASFGSVGLGTTNPTGKLKVVGEAFFDTIGINTTFIQTDQNFSVGGFQIAGDQIHLFDSQIRFDFARTSQIGVGTFGDTLSGVVDLSRAGNSFSPWVFIPQMSTTIRNTKTTATGQNSTGIGTGAIIYNTTTERIEIYLPDGDSSANVTNWVGIATVN